MTDLCVSTFQSNASVVGYVCRVDLGLSRLQMAGRWAGYLLSLLSIRGYYVQVVVFERGHLCADGVCFDLRVFLWSVTLFATCFFFRVHIFTLYLDSVLGTSVLVRLLINLCAGLVSRPSVGVFRRLSSPRSKSLLDAWHFLINRLAIFTATISLAVAGDDNLPFFDKCTERYRRVLWAIITEIFSGMPNGQNDFLA